ncbi:MAG: alpha/beta fold hydrolase [Myxococcota bacterium]
MRPAPTPMPADFFPSAASASDSASHSAADSADAEPKQPKGLVVLIPGMGDGPKRYEQKGFVDIVRRTHPHFDVVAADAHFGYYRNFRVLERLHVDVIAPIADRYEEIWVVGISIGGLVATSYAMEYGAQTTGVIVLAPYLGGRAIAEEVRDAGGLANWTPPDIEAESNFRMRHYYRLWQWLKMRTTTAPDLPRLLIGAGDEDPQRRPSELIAPHLPPSDYLTAPGGHEWRAWTPLFEALLRRALLEPSGDSR